VSYVDDYGLFLSFLWGLRSGADCCRVGSVASTFSGDAGRRRLGLLIQSCLPSPADTIQLWAGKPNCAPGC
jgi:hypothetical protein